MPQVALSTDFLQAYAAVPKAQQKKVRAFVEKFRTDPKQASIHYEPLHDMADDKVRTVRIGDDYRAVIVSPPQGDVFLCVWVDHHDEAMAWARNKHFEIHPQTGSLQVWESKPGQDKATAAPVQKAPARPVPQGRLFEGQADDTLLLLGVPEPLLPAVRALRVEADLDQLAKHLPQEASDALYMLAAGYDVDATIEELDRKAAAEKGAPTIDTEDFAAALSRTGTQRQFKVIENDQELASILDSPLERWRVFLHPSQRKLVEMNSSGSARVLGGAGTGKTVVAMHRARHLALRKDFLKPGEKILFTTFTKNLAGDIARHLDMLCGAERSSIDVRHLHGVAFDILGHAGVKPQVVSDEEQDQLWDLMLSAHPKLDFSEAFYRSEWDYVVQAQDVTTEAEYLKARRVGRGTAISREQRRKLWKVLSAYRTSLDEHGRMEYADAVREARLWLKNRSGALPYRAVVVDETQDFRQADLELLRALTPPADNDIFVVGDAHQRIYGHQSSLSRAGIQIRGRRSRHLRINYRTTQQIRSWALALLENVTVDDLDEGTDDAKRYHSLRLGVEPAIRHFRNSDAEANFLAKSINDWVKSGTTPGDICVVARTNNLVDHYRKALLEHGIETQLIKRSEGDPNTRDRPRIATMHRVKGLEFRHVVIAGVQHDQVPLKLRRGSADPTQHAAHLQAERQLLYVAATRARDSLIVTGFGDPSPFMQ